MLPIDFLIQAHLVTNAELTQLEALMAKFPELITVKNGCMNPTTFALTLKLVRDRGYQDHIGLRVIDNFEMLKKME